jgi:hypothetical protein
VGHVTFVVLAAVDEEIVWICSEIADVAELVSTDRVASTGRFVACALIPIVAHVNERKLLGLFGNLFLGVRFRTFLLDEGRLRPGREEGVPGVLQLAC